MPGPKVESIVERVAELGEAPHWSVRDQTLYYVDILGQSVHSHHPETGVDRKMKIGGGPISVIVPVKGKENAFIISQGREIGVLKWDCERDVFDSYTPVVTVDTELPNNRFNDGKCDATGRLWAGTMDSETSPGVNTPETGALYCIGKDFSLTKHLSKVTISNGMCWSSDNTIMYYIDSFQQTVDAFDFDVERGTLSNRKTVFDFKANANDPSSLPDGMVMDTTGKLWVACFGGSQVVQIDPVSGHMVSSIQFPCSYITSATFGGRHLDIMYVTSCCFTDKDKSSQPLAGSVFRVTGLGVKGYAGEEFTGDIENLKIKK